LTYLKVKPNVTFCLCWRSSGAEQLPCKQWVGGSNPPASASLRTFSLLERSLIAMPARSGRYPSGQRGQTVNLLAYAFGGSNPPLPTTVSSGESPDRGVGGLRKMREAPIRPLNGVADSTFSACGNSSAVERQPSKLGVAGSNPVSRSRDRREGIVRAHVAQLAERVLGKDEVSGSNPDMGSSFRAAVTASVNGR
jgi:hypothetical protein